LSSSTLSNTIKRTSDLLQLGASSQVTEYENRFQSLRALHEYLLSDFIISDFNNEQAYETAKQFFDSSTIRFAGIDGTMYSRPLFDLIIFFGGAYASTGTITFTKNKSTIEYDTKTLSQAAGISSVVPVYINEVPEIDQTYFDQEQPGELTLNKPLIDEAIISNATIANWIMTFAEYYLAYKLASDPNQNTHIILLDRSLSAERASLLYDTSKRELWKAKSALIGYKIDNQPIDTNDLTLGRQHITNTALRIPPARADYLRYAIINLIQQKGSLTKNQILTELDITDEKRIKRAERYLKSSVKENILTEKDDTYTINPKYQTTWTRLKKLVTIIGDRFFYEQKPETITTSNLMKIQKDDGKEQWLTTLDVAFLTLFTLHMLIEQCWKNNILLIGITKDTAARDFKRQLIPILHNESLLKGSITPEEHEKLPNTDRMILQSTSLFNPEKIKVPWTLIEYDSAFKTMIPDPQNRKGYVLGARKNRISQEKTFLKTYIQLSQAASDPLLRSNVLLIDRLTHPAYDYTPNSTIQFWNEFGSAKEPLEVLLFKDNTIENPLQNLIMPILTAMTSPSIPEAFGHNKPLFIADKIAKYNYTQFKRIADSTATWILNNHKLRKFIFYMSTFRERRTQIETTRREIG